jgi:hypothetical protein
VKTTPENNVCNECKKRFRRYTDLMLHIVAGCQLNEKQKKEAQQ